VVVGFVVVAGTGVASNSSGRHCLYIMYWLKPYKRRRKEREGYVLTAVEGTSSESIQSIFYNLCPFRFSQKRQKNQNKIEEVK